MNLRCFYNPGSLYPLERYTLGYRQLRPETNLVVFSVIAGVPPELVERDDYAALDWTDGYQRDAFYARVLIDPRMRPTVDTSKSGDDATLVPSCSSDGEFAYPPVRLVQVASDFGANGSVHSLCGGDFGPAIEGIAARIAHRLGRGCLSRELQRSADGLVSCQVDWLLPPGSVAPGTPTSCDSRQHPFLGSPDASRPRVDERGRSICEVAQLPAADGMPTGEGWYYDDFSNELPASCSSRIAFTPSAMPPTGVEVRMHCTGPIEPPPDGDTCSLSVRSGDTAAVGEWCVPSAVPAGGLDDSQVYLDLTNDRCGGAPCVAYHVRGELGAACTPRPATSTTPAVVCTDPQSVRDRVYCTCRCDAPEGAPECACPNGFSCVDLLDQGGPGIEGSYCLKNGTFTQ